MKINSQLCEVCGKMFIKRISKHKSNELVVRGRNCVTCSKRCARTMHLFINKLKITFVKKGKSEEQKRILEMLDKYEGVILSDFQKSWLKAKIKEDGKK